MIIKIVGKMIVYLALTMAGLALLYLLGLQSFLPDPTLSQHTMKAAIVTTIILVIGLMYKTIMGTEEDSADDKKLSAKTLIAAPFLIFGSSYIAIGYTAPHLLTNLTGTPEIIALEVIDTDSMSRRGGCQYTLIPAVERPFLFNLCISKDTWTKLPAVPFIAEFTVTPSRAGIVFNKVFIPDIGVEETFSIASHTQLYFD